MAGVKCEKEVGMFTVFQGSGSDIRKLLGKFHMLMRVSISLRDYWFLSWASRYWLVFKNKYEKFICLGFHFSFLCWQESIFVKVSTLNCFRIQF